jgi:RNA polymerase sigma-70 factor (ECF subfamily)
VYRTTGNGADADDIVQESFLRLLRAGPASNEDGQQRRFLYRIASNLMIDRWRGKQRDERRPSPTAAPTPTCRAMMTSLASLRI